MVAMISLGSAARFAVLAASTITNTGATEITGAVGLYPGTSITGFGSVTHHGKTFVHDPVAMKAEADALTAYNTLAGLPSTENLTGTDLGGLTLTAGVYTFSSSAQLTGKLTLVGPGPFVFQIGSTLTTASNSAVIAQDCRDIYWQVGSSATLGTGTAFMGTIIAKASDTLDTNATMKTGRAFALTGAVTLDDNTINRDVPLLGPTADPSLNAESTLINHQSFDSWSTLSPGGGVPSSLDLHSATAHAPIVAVGSVGHAPG
jgi:hypothetical protein